jgi:AcrR family transcriptional regulator
MTGCGTKKRSIEGVTPVKATAAGRPARLSRQMILEKSIVLLEQCHYPFEAFTLARIADELGSVSMALYNYFPSREALLNAVADHICMRFKMPAIAVNAPWQEVLRTWLWAFKSHAEHYPVIFKVMGFDGQTSAGWLRISVTVGKTLYAQGMTGKELALTSWLFCCNAISLVHSELLGHTFRSSISLRHLEELGLEEQEFFLMLRPFHIQISSSDALEEGFNQLIAMVELKLKDKQDVGGFRQLE